MQSKTLFRIEELIKQNHLPHTIIIEGDGDKKSTLATYIAKALLCEKASLCCNSCKSCHLSDIGAHPDIKILFPEKRNYSVDVIRDLKNESYLSPFMSEGRVFIINEAEKLTIACQNALLKLLEEPPKNVNFILLTNNTSTLLSTVKSRAVIFNYDGSENQDDEAFIIATKQLFKLAEDKNKYEISKLLFQFNDRAKAEKLMDFIKQKALNILKDKHKGVATAFTEKALNNIIIKTEELNKKLFLNPPMKLIFALLSEYLTEF